MICKFNYKQNLPLSQQKTIVNQQVNNNQNESESFPLCFIQVGEGGGSETQY